MRSRRRFPRCAPARALAARLGPRAGAANSRGWRCCRRAGWARSTSAARAAASCSTGNALHADLTPESSLGGGFGWILCAIGQQRGFPVPQGGSGRLTDALVRRLESRGGRVVCASRVDAIVIRRGRATGVRLADGTRGRRAARDRRRHGRAAAVPRASSGREHLPARVLDGLRKFQYDNSTIKVDWALTAPVPWSDPVVRQAGTVHIGESMDHLTTATTELERRLIPGRPFLLFGQYAAADDTRAPAGADTAWAYTHVPQQALGDSRGELTGRWDERELERFAERMEDEIERFAPGFRDCVAARHIAGPRELEAANANLVNGAINGGTAKLHQQLVFRPVPGLGRPGDADPRAVPGLGLRPSRRRRARRAGLQRGACAARAPAACDQGLSPAKNAASFAGSGGSSVSSQRPRLFTRGAPARRRSARTSAATGRRRPRAVPRCPAPPGPRSSRGSSRLRHSQIDASDNP